MPDFKHLGKSGFPHADNVNVYKYDNDLDYSRYDYDQMDLCICNVPWDQGEAHIGQRTIEGIGNVVWFGSEAKRDAWFDAIPDDKCFRWTTRFKELHRDMRINVPLPYDMCANYNYLAVRYHLFANDGSPVQYEGTDGLREWFYFVREFNFVSPNTTELVLMDDAWQTWMYRYDVTQMQLLRGHAPMLKTDATRFLGNPLERCDDLLAEDVNYGELSRVSKSQATVLNQRSMWACIATSADPSGDWAWNVPSQQACLTSGTPGVFVMAVPAAELELVLSAAHRASPQFIQSVQAVFFVSRDYLELSDGFGFCGRTCYRVVATSHVSADALTLDKRAFGYDERYADIAKLYTWPYAALEVTDAEGNVEVVKVEDTTGRLTLDTVANLVFPYLRISGTIGGIGGAGGMRIGFSNVTQRTFEGDGRWYCHLREWKIPTFCVTLDPATEFAYSRHFDVAQMGSDRDTNRDVTKASATTDRDNATAMAVAQYDATVTQASAGQSNSNAEANNVTNNAAATVTANNAINSNSNATASSDATLNNALAQAIQAWDAGLTRATTNNEVEKANASASVSAAGGVANSAVGGAVSGAQSAGLAGAVAGAIGGLVSGGISAATSLATNSIAVNAMETQAENIVSNSQSKLQETQRNNIDRTNNANSGKTANTRATNTMTSTQAANTASTMMANATRTYNATVGAAEEVKDATEANAGRMLSTSSSNADAVWSNEGTRIGNLTAQAALRAPFVFGSVSDGEFATTRPQALYCNVVTESDYAIQLAGDTFLRYGYMYGKRWDFDGDWNVGRHFTYWQLSDFWAGAQIPDRFADQLRFFLFGGVTVWRNPNDIGRVSIYDNWPESEE